MKPWMRQAKLGGQLIAPSILSADFSKLGSEILDVEKNGADWIHVDVMDGHFVPNLTLGAPIVKSIRPITKLPLDCHLMVSNPEDRIKEFIEAGADGITIHIEACPNPERLIAEIQKHGLRAGLTLRPGTPLEKLLPYLKLIELVLVMTVEPGFGGQSFMPEQVSKILKLRQEIKTQNLKTLIQVDGGVSAKTLTQVAEADCLVAGSAVFAQADRAASLKALVQSF